MFVFMFSLNNSLKAGFRETLETLALNRAALNPVHPPLYCTVGVLHLHQQLNSQGHTNRFYEEQSMAHEYL